MPVSAQAFPEILNLLEVRSPTRAIRYWLNRRSETALDPQEVLALFVPALPAAFLPKAPAAGRVEFDLLGYDPKTLSALVRLRNTDLCFLCGFDPATGAFSSRRVAHDVVTNFIVSRQSLLSVSRSIDVVDAARRWLSRCRN